MLGCHVLSLTFSLTRLVLFHSCSRLDLEWHSALKRASAVGIHKGWTMVVIIHCVSEKRHQLCNGIAQNYKDRFLQRVSIACYAERCISYDRFCPTV